MAHRLERLSVQQEVRAAVAVTSYAQAVEELVLNSVDAGASSIDVRLDLDCYRFAVADDGRGIPSRELRDFVGVSRATSKSRTFDDVMTAATHGARGEALRSLALTSILEVQSRSREPGAAAYAKVVRAGQMLSFGASAAPANPGTTVVVRDAFFKWPVRRRAMDPGAQAARVRDAVAAVALARPKMAFCVAHYSRGRPLLELCAADSVPARAAQLFGAERAALLQEVQAVDCGGFRLRGWLSPPATDASHWSRELQFVYVNGRWLRRFKLVHRAVAAAYSRCFTLLQGRPAQEGDRSGRYGEDGLTPSVRRATLYPMFILFLECPKERCDVLAEPDKSGVTFDDPAPARACVAGLLAAFLSRYPHAVPDGLLRDLRAQVAMPAAPTGAGRQLQGRSSTLLPPAAAASSSWTLPPSTAWRPWQPQGAAMASACSPAGRDRVALSEIGLTGLLEVDLSSPPEDARGSGASPYFGRSEDGCSPSTLQQSSISRSLQGGGRKRGSLASLDEVRWRSSSSGSSRAKAAAAGEKGGSVRSSCEIVSRRSERLMPQTGRIDGGGGRSNSFCVSGRLKSVSFAPREGFSAKAAELGKSDAARRRDVPSGQPQQQQQQQQQRLQQAQPRRPAFGMTVHRPPSPPIAKAALAAGDGMHFKGSQSSILPQREPSLPVATATAAWAAKERKGPGCFGAAAGWCGGEEAGGKRRRLLSSADSDDGNGSFRLDGRLPDDRGYGILTKEQSPPSLPLGDLGRGWRLRQGEAEASDWLSASMAEEQDRAGSLQLLGAELSDVPPDADLELLGAPPAAFLPDVVTGGAACEAAERRADASTLLVHEEEEEEVYLLPARQQRQLHSATGIECPAVNGIECPAGLEDESLGAEQRANSSPGRFFGKIFFGYGNGCETTASPLAAPAPASLQQEAGHLAAGVAEPFRMLRMRLRHAACLAGVEGRGGDGGGRGIDADCNRHGNCDRPACASAALRQRPRLTLQVCGSVTREKAVAVAADSNADTSESGDYGALLGGSCAGGDGDAKVLGENGSSRGARCGSVTEDTEDGTSDCGDRADVRFNGVPELLEVPAVEEAPTSEKAGFTREKQSEEEVLDAGGGGIICTVKEQLLPLPTQPSASWAQDGGAEDGAAGNLELPHSAPAAAAGKESYDDEPLGDADAAFGAEVFGSSSGCYSANFGDTAPCGPHALPVAPMALTASMLSSADVVGQAARKFIMLRANSSSGGDGGGDAGDSSYGASAASNVEVLLCLDQHAADERIRLEALELQVYGPRRDERNVGSLVLRPPEPLRATSRGRALLETHREALAAWRFEFELTSAAPANAGVSGGYRGFQNGFNGNGGGFGGGTVSLLVKTVPVVCGVRLAAADILSFAHHIDDRVGGSGAGAAFWVRPPQVQRVLATQACHRAIRFGDALSLERCRKLVSKLAACKLPFQCAHGRPSVVPLCVLTSRGRGAELEDGY